ncbi:MAG: DNA repair protein RecO [Candidatus Omnitrophica bacterium]|nr:DNA repair protein RecO [Candidatus Omnitrophota bacterium]
MAIQKSEGILLRRQDLRETSIILTFYTKDFGKIRGIVRGVRGPRAQWTGGGGLELFAHDDIVFYERKRADVYTISQCDLIDYFNPIRESLEKLSYATYIIELLDSVTALSDKNAEVFNLILNSLRLLSGQASPRRVARIFEIKLLSLLGLMPNMGCCSSCGTATAGGFRFSLRHGGLLCKECLANDNQAFSILPGTAKFMEHVAGSNFDKAARIKVSEEVGRELERILRSFLDYHIERRLRTVHFIKDVGNF